MGRKFFYYDKGGKKMIKLQNVSKTFYVDGQTVEAVKHATIEINKGEIFGIIGFSGAGKSTLVRCINLLERPTSGKVYVDNQDLLSLSEKQLRETRKKIGMIFQHFNLMKSRSVYQNVALPLKNSGLTKNEIEQKVMSLLELVDLQDKRDSYPSQLSGGQKQRVAIARALANDPQVLLCDEATSALDPQTTQSILKLLKTVNEKMGITIVLITHEMAVIKDICDRVAVMENGEIKEMGDIIDIFANPKANITKSFIETASNINKIYDLIKNDSDIVKMKPGEKMLMLTYSSDATGDALISTISREFNVNANIVFGNVEMLKHSPLGKLVIILSGESSQIEQAEEYIRKCHVKVEVIKTC